MDRYLRAQRDHLVGLLRQARLDAGMRQADVAKRLNRPQSFVSKYETGERRLDLIELRQVCAALDIPLLSLIRRFELTLDARAAERPPGYPKGRARRR